MKNLIGGVVGGIAGTIIYQLIIHPTASIDFYRAVFVGTCVGIGALIGAKLDKKRA